MGQALKDTLRVIKKCYQALDDKKAINIRILKLAEKSSITDYFVIASGTSEPHIRALRRELENQLRAANLKNLRIDYQPNSGWAVVDGFDFMIHIFGPEAREHYGLETLWNDAEELDIESL